MNTAASTPGTVELKNPRPAVLRDLTAPDVQQNIEAEALSDARDYISRYIRRRARSSATTTRPRPDQA